MKIILTDGSIFLNTLGLLFFALFATSFLLFSNYFDNTLLGIIMLFSLLLLFSIFDDDKHRTPNKNKKSISLKFFVVLLFLILVFSDINNINFVLLISISFISLYWIGRHYEIIKHKRYDEDWNEVIY